MLLVNRRIGGLEIATDISQQSSILNRRIGGLEILFVKTFEQPLVNRRIGGLKTCGTLAAATCWI